MKLFEEFKLYENMWNDIKSAKSTLIEGALNKEPLHEIKVPVKRSATPTVYLVFNYGTINNLDNYYLHAVCLNKAEAIASLIEEAEYRIQNYSELDNSLYCYAVDPADYDIALSELKQAAAAKHSGGVDLHWEYTDVVYALCSIAEHETPLYELSMADIWADYYVAYLASTGYDIDSIDETDLYAMQDLLSELADDEDFKKFIISKLTAEVNSAM